MPHVRVSIDKTKPGAVGEVVRRAWDGLLPIYRGRPGFIAYEVVATGEDEAVFISTWESREQAEATIETAAAWVRENVPDLIVSAEHHVGDLSYSTRGT